MNPDTTAPNRCKKRPDISNFDELPDDALVSVPYGAEVTDQGVSTMWRHAKTDPDLKPIRLGTRQTKLRVGGIRAYIAKKAGV